MSVVYDQQEKLNEYTASAQALLEQAKHSTPPLKPITSQIKQPIYPGLNPAVDAAQTLFTRLSELQLSKTSYSLPVLQQELINIINTFQNSMKCNNHAKEYILVYSYTICATFDDVISHCLWGSNWPSYSLLTYFHQDAASQTDGLFSLIERINTEPARYIELMEFIYLCLSLGYQGPYRHIKQGRYQLENQLNTLYHRIRSYRGHISQTLSPSPIKAKRITIKQIKPKLFTFALPLLITCSLILTVFISLNYLMENLSDEAYSPIQHIQTTSNHTYPK